MEQRSLADSNTIIEYVGNKMPGKTLMALDKYFNQYLALSIITKIEVLGFNEEEDQLKMLNDFIGLANIFYVNDTIADRTIQLRKEYKIKTPDAIIAATALVNDLILFTRNISDFKKIDGLKIINPWDL